MNLEILTKTAKLSLLRPREGFRVVLGWNLSLSESALALTLMAVLSAGLISLVLGPVPPEIDPVTARILANPIYLAVAQLAGLVTLGACVHLLGRVTKGQGTIPQAIAMMAWFEALMIAVSLAQSVVLMLVPPLGVLLIPAGMILSLWLIASFTAELQGYASVFLSLLGVIAAFVVAMFGLVFVLFLALALGVLHV